MLVAAIDVLNIVSSISLVKVALNEFTIHLNVELLDSLFSGVS